MRFIRVGAWVKNNSAPQFTGDRPAQGFEAIAIMHREGERLRWNGGGSRGVWITDVERNNGHPTPKPLSLINDWILKFTDEGETIIDPFMGSGTTLVACAKLGRKAIGIEISEEYYEIAVQRSGMPTRSRACFRSHLRESSNKPYCDSSPFVLRIVVQFLLRSFAKWTGASSILIIGNQINLQRELASVRLSVPSPRFLLLGSSRG
jgi:hypothetical protein